MSVETNKNEETVQSAPQNKNVKSVEYIYAELKINKIFRDLIPPLSGEEFEGLEQNILTNGCEQPIKLWNGYIVDGHNRYAICTKHSIPFKTEELKKEAEQDVILWIIDHQLDRRNISLYSRGKLILRRKSEVSKGQGHRSDLDNVEPDHNCGQVDDDPKDQPSANSPKVKNKTDVREELSKLSGIGSNTLSRIAKIEESATPEQKKALEENRASINEVFTKIQKEEKRANRDATLQAMDFPEGKYRIIYADPPWSYGDNRTGIGGAIEQYPTMSLEDICKLPVPDITDENAVLFLWATTPLIREGLQVIESWGFEYKTLFTWDKVRSFFGHYNAVAQEFLLIGTKGSCLPDSNILPHSVVRIEKGRHSEKPEGFRQLIDSMYKYGNRVELFARKKTEGWEVYGNECA